MLQTNASAWEIIDKIYDFLIANPWSLLLIPVIWLSLIYILKEFIGIYVSAWSVLLSLLVAVGIVIGIAAIAVSG